VFLCSHARGVSIYTEALAGNCTLWGVKAYVTDLSERYDRQNVKGNGRWLGPDIRGNAPWIFTFQALQLSVQQLTVRHNLIIHSSQTTKLNVYTCLNEQHAVNILGCLGARAPCILKIGIKWLSVEIGIWSPIPNSENKTLTHKKFWIKNYHISKGLWQWIFIKRTLCGIMCN
jgi:hypothetical protein